MFRVPALWKTGQMSGQRGPDAWFLIRAATLENSVHSIKLLTIIYPWSYGARGNWLWMWSLLLLSVFSGTMDLSAPATVLALLQWPLLLHFLLPVSSSTSPCVSYLPSIGVQRPLCLLLQHGGRERADETERHGHQAPGEPHPERSGSFAGDRQQDVLWIQRLARARRDQRLLLQTGEEAPAAGQGVGHWAAAAQRQGQGETWLECWPVDYGVCKQNILQYLSREPD